MISLHKDGKPNEDDEETCLEESSKVVEDKIDKTPYQYFLRITSREDAEDTDNMIHSKSKGIQR